MKLYGFYIKQIRTAERKRTQTEENPCAQSGNSCDYPLNLHERGVMAERKETKTMPTLFYHETKKKKPFVILHFAERERQRERGGIKQLE